MFTQMRCKHIQHFRLTRLVCAGGVVLQTRPLGAVEGLWLCGLGFSAMVPIVAVTVPSQTFEQYRLRMRQHFNLPNQLNTSRCVACRRPETRSEAGRREHHKTGACEACWDALAASSPEARVVAAQRCTRLNGAAACEYFLTWIEVKSSCSWGKPQSSPRSCSSHHWHWYQCSSTSKFVAAK